MKGDFIKNIRQDLNLTIKELAEKTGYSPRTVEGWEQGRPVPEPALKIIDLWMRIRDFFLENRPLDDDKR